VTIGSSVQGGQFLLSHWSALLGIILNSPLRILFSFLFGVLFLSHQSLPRSTGRTLVGRFWGLLLPTGSLRPFFCGCFSFDVTPPTQGDPFSVLQAWSRWPAGSLAAVLLFSLPFGVISVLSSERGRVFEIAFFPLATGFPFFLSGLWVPTAVTRVTFLATLAPLDGR